MFVFSSAIRRACHFAGDCRVSPAYSSFCNCNSLLMVSDNLKSLVKLGGVVVALTRLTGGETGDPGTDEHIAALPVPDDGTVTFEADAEPSESVSWTVEGGGETITFEGNPVTESIPFGAVYTVSAHVTGGETERTYTTTLDLTQ